MRRFLAAVAVLTGIAGSPNLAGAQEDITPPTTEEAHAVIFGEFDSDYPDTNAARRGVDGIQVEVTDVVVYPKLVRELGFTGFYVGANVHITWYRGQEIDTHRTRGLDNGEAFFFTHDLYMGQALVGTSDAWVVRVFDRPMRWPE